LRASAIAELERERAARTNRYVWEGGFFLVVLAGGMLILTRAIRHDAELRRRQQNFLAAVSHEFKSPLASVQLAAETLVLRADADGKRLGERILEDCERLLRMVDNLLDTTRLEEGRHRLVPERIDLRTGIAASVAEVAERAARHGIKIAVDVPEALVLNVDRTALESILRNLLDNAVKACVAGPGTRIEVTAVHANGKAELTVRDDGLGFPPEEAAMMFEKFYRLGDELRRRTPGTGLGLYLVKRLAEMSGATVGATSAGPGRGAAVTVTWPEGALQ
jgi:signal transduction histidine kinase